ncbi:unnamed protein product [Medioppia subpectinata]|uniref:C2H2-type domain-containing protein n=1 Tax=Medioppia subpectinata TaxID=1979941 RepID=A0A7R9KKG4_9ACAR|nr:unnamed protein product [Medioppia subpectinata]CAG2105103.1 unnamed protein product [Medioppia subpectinata]
MRRLERMDDVLLPMIDLKLKAYVCDWPDCGYRSANKRVFYQHYCRHNDVTRTDGTVHAVDHQLRERGSRRLPKFIPDLIQPEHILDNQYVCNDIMCHFKTEDKERFYNHLRRHRMPRMTRKEFRRYERWDDAVMPFLDRKTRIYACNRPDCGHTSTSIALFYKHLVSHGMTVGRKEPKAKADSIQDDEPGEESPTQSRKTQYINERIGKYKVDDQYVCREIDCHFKATNKRLFYSHWAKHNLARGRAQRLSAKFDLSLERPFACDWPECGLAFKQIHHLNGHKDRHMGIKRFACDWPGCDYRCDSNVYLLEHRRTHTKEKPRECSWPGCEYSCSSKRGMDSHLRKHTGEKPFECPFPECGFRTSGSSALTNHKRRHTGEKPYFCIETDCGKRFSSAAGLYIHRRGRHKSDICLTTRGRKPKQNSTQEEIKAEIKVND